MAHGPTQEAVSLVLALCHEVGNELAAARLSAHWGAREADPDQRALAAAGVDVSLARAGAMLAEIQPLLARSSAPARGVDPVEILSDVRRDLRPLRLGPIQVEVRIPRRAPRVRADARLLCVLLVDRVLRACARDGIAREGILRLGGRRRDDRFVLRLSGLRAVGDEDAWLGRARAALGPLGTRVEVSDHRGRRALDVILPLASAPRARASRAGSRISAR